MFGLQRVPPLVRTATMMLLLGGLVGYVGTAFTTTFVADSGILGNSGESNAAHKYMLALLQRQSESLSQQPQDVKPLTVTYLGGASTGRISVQIYAVEVQASGGQYQFLPFSLTLIGGRVQRVE